MENIGTLENNLANTSAVFQVPCHTLEGSTEIHRILVQRDGTILTPDHISESENIIQALGGFTNNPCSYWKIAAGNEISILGDNIVPADIENWQFGQIITSWTAKAVWSSLSVLLGKPTYTVLNPEEVLKYIKIYSKHKILVNPIGRLSLHANALENFLNPSTRHGGYRRNTPVTPEEVDLLIQSGLPTNLLPSAACLGYSLGTAKIMLKESNRLDIQPDTAIHLSEIFTPEETCLMLQAMTKVQAKLLPERLVLLASRNHNLTLEDLKKVFLT